MCCSRHAAQGALCLPRRRREIRHRLSAMTVQRCKRGAQGVLKVFEKCVFSLTCVEALSAHQLVAAVSAHSYVEKDVVQLAHSGARRCVPEGLYRPVALPGLPPDGRRARSSPRSPYSAFTVHVIALECIPHSKHSAFRGRCAPQLSTRNTLHCNPVLCCSSLCSPLPRLCAASRLSSAGLRVLE